MRTCLRLCGHACGMSLRGYTLLLRSRFLSGHGALATLTSPRVGLRALSPHRKAASMPKPSITSNIAEALNIELDVRAQRPFDHVLVFNYLTNAAGFIFGPVVSLAKRIDFCFFQNLPGPRPSDAENGGERKLTSLIGRYVYSSNSWHVCLSVFKADRNDPCAAFILAAACSSGSSC